MAKISILVTTYNRKEKLRRCLSSILSQTYTDFEVIIIDDYSQDGTQEVIPNDPRISYIRNAANFGAEHGDRIHIKRFVDHLATGKYFTYICDDDEWIAPNLLARQIALFEAYPEASMVIGGQLSNYVGTAKYFHRDLYPSMHMLSREFLDHFAEHPIECNIIIGATLYNREKFIESGALKWPDGAKWQAGYEMLLAPGQYGDVLYINEPCILTEISPENASFQRTQLEHYQDSVTSVRSANLPIDLERKVIDNIGKAYLANAKHIQDFGCLTMCSKENISRPVTKEDLIHV